MFFGKRKDEATKGVSPSPQSSPTPTATGRHKTSTDVLLEDLHVVKENHRLHPQAFTWSSQHLMGEDPKR